MKGLSHFFCFLRELIMDILALMMPDKCEWKAVATQLKFVNRGQRITDLNAF